MTNAEKTTLVGTMINDTNIDSATIGSYLALAEQKILQRVYPFGNGNEYTMPTRYEYIQCELAARYILRRGSEGEVVHNENGINRTYASANDEDLLGEVMQVVIRR
jgi:hypothetical protein